MAGVNNVRLRKDDRMLRFFKNGLAGFLFLLIMLSQAPSVSAQTTYQTDVAQQAYPYYRATVKNVLNERIVNLNDAAPGYIQELQLQRQDTGEKLTLTIGSEFQPLNQQQRLKPGSKVLLTEQMTGEGTMEYVIADVYRLPLLAWLLVGFLALVVVVARWQGLFSIVGMMVSLGILTMYIVPQILHGTSPMLVSIVGAGFIAAITVYVCHGFSWHSHVALASMISTLAAVTGLSYLAVRFAQLVGLGSEEAYFLQFGTTANINLQGLLLGGIVLGALGILDDITIAQTSTVKQLFLANSDLSPTELYERALAVGKDHVASLVNTLVLAYAGANLPLFLLFTINKSIPWWVTLNNEIIAEEVVRTLVGSIGLVIAVPLSTLLAVMTLHYQRSARAHVLAQPTAVSKSRRRGRRA